jgi:rhodanese-related sulfurtransferase/DNA-binding transcriptional ArsR family regulator
MNGRAFKDAVYEQFALVAQAFSSPKRIEIIDVLAQGERSVESLAQETGLTVANTSRHLQVLKGANLVTARKSGLQSLYRLADPAVLSGYRALRHVAEARLAEVQRLVRDYYQGVDDLEPIPFDDLLDRVRKGSVTVLDVRPREEFEAGHVEGARSVPLAELEQAIARLPRRKEVIAYCRGPYCVLAAQAVRALRDKGYRARRMEDGYPEWRDAGHPVASPQSR